MMNFEWGFQKLKARKVAACGRSVPQLTFESAAIARKIGIVIVGLGALIVPASAQQITLSFDSATVARGGTATLTLLSGGSAQAAALEWTLTYPAADIASVTPSTDPADTAIGKAVACNSSNGSTVCILAGLNNTPITTGAVAAVALQVSSSAPDSVIPIQLSNVVAVAADGSSLSAVGTGGSLTISNSTATSLGPLSCLPASVVSPASSTCTVSLTGAAPTPSVTVALGSNNANVTVPSKVTISAGKTTATFSAQVASVSSTQTANLTASWANQSKAFSLKVTPATSNSASLPDGIYTIKNQYSGYLMDDPAFSVSSGTQIVQWPATGGQNQNWKFTSNSSGQFTIQNLFSGLYLADVNGVLQQVLQNNKQSQLWVLKTVSSGAYTITNLSTRRLIEDPSFSKSSGRGIATWVATGGNNQNWVIK
jgi:hypothetical protein